MTEQQLIVGAVAGLIAAFVFYTIRVGAVRRDQALRELMVESLLCGHPLTGDPPSDFAMQLVKKGSVWVIRATGNRAVYESPLYASTEEMAVSEFERISKRAAAVIKEGWRERVITAVAIDQQGNIVEQMRGKDE